MASREQIERIAKLATIWGVRVCTEPVCEGHSAPGEFLAEWVYDRPSMSLVCGPRGGGKSFLRALAIHLDSLVYQHLGTRILGGSLAQSQQIYEALEAFHQAIPEPSVFKRLLNTAAEYKTGSKVSILAASSTSVRGPHVPNLCLDEVDEIAPDIRESATGMCMALRGVSASIAMTSTWHRVGGPMTELIEKGRSGVFPVHTFCAFEVLERCPEERSGPNLEHCPSCPLVKWCHGDIGGYGQGIPKAKRSSGHYEIDSLIQKVQATSERIFESDYLCLGPKADGVWFTQFTEANNVSREADYDPALSVHISVDSGVHTGAVLAQRGPDNSIRIFDEHFAEGLSAEENGTAILAKAHETAYPSMASRHFRVSTDSAGGARNPVGPTVLAEYERVGLKGPRGIECWPKYAGSISDSLKLIEAMVRSADGSVSLKIHPRCKRTIAAFQGYRRAKRADQWQDYPEDPQHPHEEMIDAVRGMLKIEFPEGRKPPLNLPRIHAGRLL